MTEASTIVPAVSAEHSRAKPGSVSHPWLVIVVAQQRSGTTAFGRTLSEGRKIHTFGEVFHNARGNSETNYFNFKERRTREQPCLSFASSENQEHLWNSYLHFLKSCTSKPFVLLDVKYNSWHHFNAIWYLTGEAPAMIRLVRRSRVRVLHIIRRNLFEQACSAFLASQRQQFHFTEPPEPIRLTLDPHRLLARMTSSQEQTELFRKFFAGYRHYCKLFYEDIFQGDKVSEGTLDAVSGLIGQDCDGERRVRFVKSTPPPRDLVQNREEIIEFFSGKQFSHMVAEGLCMQSPNS